MSLVSFTPYQKKKSEEDVLFLLDKKGFFSNIRQFGNQFFIPSDVSLYEENIISSLTKGLIVQNYFSDLFVSDLNISEYSKHKIAVLESSNEFLSSYSLDGKRFDNYNFDSVKKINSMDSLIESFSNFVTDNLNGRLVRNISEMILFSKKYFSSLISSLNNLDFNYSLVESKKADSLSGWFRKYYNSNGVSSNSGVGVSSSNSKKASLKVGSIDSSLDNLNSSSKINSSNVLISSNVGDSLTYSSKNFDDFIGSEDIKRIIRVSLIKPFLESIAYHKIKKKPKKISDYSSFMLFGPPGTGKSHFAECLAGELGVPFFYVYSSDFIKSYLGEGKDALIELYEKASLSAPSMVFIDEVDEITKVRSVYDSKKSDLTTAFLSLTFGNRAKQNVVSIAATNIPESIDKAVTNRVPIQNIINFPPVTEEVKRKIFSYHLDKYYSDNLSDSQISEISKKISFNAARRIEQFVNYSSKIAFANNHEKITFDDINEAISDYSNILGT